MLPNVHHAGKGAEASVTSQRVAEGELKGVVGAGNEGEGSSTRVDYVNYEKPQSQRGARHLHCSK